MKKAYFIICLLILVFISSIIHVTETVEGYQDIFEKKVKNGVSQHSQQWLNQKIEHPVEGCSSFCLSNPISCVFGTNCDYFSFTSGQLFVNKKDVVKTGLETGTTGKRVEWKSKFGSLTFNFIGYQMAWGGMNEAGLVISTMNLPETKMPAPDERPPLNSGFWIQYQLDNHATVEEVLASDSSVRIANTEKDHYLVCDKEGHCAVIEFLDGKMVYHTGRTLPVNVLTNSTYAESIDAWKKNKLYGDSLPRFALAADEVGKKYTFASNKATIFYAFYILSLVSRPYTVWSIVFDNQELQVYFISQRNQQMRRIDFEKLDFSTKTPVRMLDVHAPLEGDISDSLLPYSHQASLDHLKKSFQVFAPGVQDDEIEALLEFLENYPNTESM